VFLLWCVCQCTRLLTQCRWLLTQDMEGDVEVPRGLWEFWAPLLVALTATLGLSAYSKHIYQDLAEEEEEDELAVIKEKKRLGLELTTQELQVLKRDKEGEVELSAIVEKQQRGIKLTRTELRALQKQQRKEERKQRTSYADVGAKTEPLRLEEREEREEMVGKPHVVSRTQS
jgi:hypothetical protein